MTKRFLEHPSNRFDEWVAILQRSQALFVMVINRHKKAEDYSSAFLIYAFFERFRRGLGSILG